MTYTARSESVILPAAVRRRPVVGVERLVGEDYLPLEQGTNRGRETHAAAVSHLRGLLVDENYYIEGEYIHLYPRPTSDETLRLRYVAAHTDVTTSDSASSPSIFPAEHHAVIALGVALSFKRETDVATALEREYAERRERLRRWAAASPHAGPRHVREEY